MAGYFLDDGQCEVANLNVVSMRLIVSKAQSNGAFGMAEFRGVAPWTVLHVHRHMEESFYVLEGAFAFTCGDLEVEASEGAFLMVPRGTPHVMRAGPGGGRLLAQLSPAGLEDMFLELGRLPGDGITNPDVRAETTSRHDSIPV